MILEGLTYREVQVLWANLKVVDDFTNELEQKLWNDLLAREERGQDLIATMMPARRTEESK